MQEVMQEIQGAVSPAQAGKTLHGSPHASPLDDALYRDHQSSDTVGTRVRVTMAVGQGTMLEAPMWHTGTACMSAVCAAGNGTMAGSPGATTLSYGRSTRELADDPSVTQGAW